MNVSEGRIQRYKKMDFLGEGQVRYIKTKTWNSVVFFNELAFLLK